MAAALRSRSERGWSARAHEARTLQNPLQVKRSPTKYCRSLSRIRCSAERLISNHSLDSSSVSPIWSADALTTPNMPSQRHVVALGSSFASGIGVPPVIQSGLGLGQSGRNYPRLLAEKLSARLTDLSCSGATLSNILDNPQSTLMATVPPQLDSLPSDADIVTITAGGNDLGYAGGLIKDSALAATGPLRQLLDMVDANPPSPLSVEQLTERFIRVIDRVHEKAPTAKIYLVTYLHVFGACSFSSKDTTLDASRIQHYIDVAQQLVQANVAAAQQRPHVQLVPVHELSVGHEVGSDANWVEGFTWALISSGTTPYHPNVNGHIAVADELYSRIIEQPAPANG